MNNRNLKFEERPALQGVGNNRHARNIRAITEYISMSGDSANTMDIYYWLNGNTKQGLQMNALVNILAKGPYISIGEESATNGLGVPRRVKIWKLKVDKVVERRDNNE